MNLTQGNVWRQYLRYLMPSLGGALVVSIYSFVDTMAVGQGVGPSGSAALAVVTPLFQISAFAGILCGMGGSVLMSVARGAGDEKAEQESFAQSVIGLLIAGGSIVAACWFFRDAIYAGFGSTPALSADVYGYGDFLILGFPFLMGSTFLGFFLRADNDPNLIFIASLIGGTFNIIGDWLFVFPMQMGTFGAALATVLGAVIQFLVLCTHFLSKRNTLSFWPGQISLSRLMRLYANGFGSAFLEMALVITTLLINNAIMRWYDQDVLAIFGVLLTIAALAVHMFQGIAQAAQPLLSQNYGAGKNGRVLASMKCALIACAIIAVLELAICMVFPVQIMQFFLACTDSILIKAPAITRWYSASIPFMGFSTLMVAFLQSVEQPSKALLLTVLRGFVLITVLMICLPPLVGAHGIWLAVLFNESIVFALGCLLCLQCAKKLKQS